MSFFKPPIIRSTASLNRALFARTYDLAAAAVKDVKQISVYRKALEKSEDLLRLERISSIAAHPDPSQAAEGRRCLLLKPGISASAPETWSDTLKEGVKEEQLTVIPYELKLGYEYWTCHDTLRAILPEEYADDIPASFNTVGHVAHLNLRSHFLPYKHVIAQVISDKNSHIRTVINKVDNVGTESEYRTFSYEVLAGPDDMEVEVREADCVHRFNYAKVYWNSKLETEHKRIVEMFRPGEVVCDVMAGIGPFAIPAGKKKVFVWANDKNPEGYSFMKDGIERNKVSQYVRPFNQDGKDFIKFAAESVLEAATQGQGVTLPPPKQRRSEQRAGTPRPAPTRIRIPPTISHFVMNLPASAITFLPAFKGLYAGREDLFSSSAAAAIAAMGGTPESNHPAPPPQLPMVYVHCFAVKSDTDEPRLDICERISKELGMQMKYGDAANDGKVSVHHVRDVAPNKSMYCASFRLPAEVAFAPRT